MKSLDQIEPRTPISSAPYTITQPGAYYLTTNIVSTFSDAIIIATNNVTLDLNGFTISSTYSGNAGSAIWLNGGNMNITIFNGHIVSGVTNNGANLYAGPGFFNGIYFSLPPPQNMRVSGLTVSGTAYYGIYLGTGNSTLVENCEAHTIGDYGIWASVVKSSSALDCQFTAIVADHAADCRGQCTTANGDGVSASSTVQNSYGITTNGASGIYCGGTVENSYGSASSTGTGIAAGTAIINSVGNNTGNGYGLTADNVENSSGTTSGSGYGITADTAHNCYGSAGSGGTAIFATTVQNCQALASSGGSLAINADNALNCFGTINGGTGTAISATTAENCEGINYGSGLAIDCFVAHNCYGYSSGGGGIHAARIAMGCDGETGSLSAIALKSDGTAEACSGNNPAGGTAIKAVIGIGCVRFNGSNNISGAYLGTVSP